MKDNVLSTTRYEVGFVPPAGKYIGTWSAYIITVPLDARNTWTIHTKHGVRGVNVPVTVTVSESGEITIE